MSYTYSTRAALDLKLTRVAFSGARRFECRPNRKHEWADAHLRLEALGRHQAQVGYTCCTGNAPGSDVLFAAGVNSVNPALLELYQPWDHHHTEQISSGNKVFTYRYADARAWEIAELCHPSWSMLSSSVRKLMVRNVQLVEHASMLFAFPNMKRAGWGGTGHTIRVAWYLGIPVFHAISGEQLEARLGQPRKVG